MRIYVAAPFCARSLAGSVADELEEAGHEVTSEWLRSTRDITDAMLGAALAHTDEEVFEHAQGDFDDIDRSDALVQLTGNFCMMHHEYPKELMLHTGGRQIEVGYALAKEKDIHILGAPENVFTRSMSFQHLSVEDCISFLADLDGLRTITG